MSFLFLLRYHFLWLGWFSILINQIEGYAGGLGSRGSIQKFGSPSTSKHGIYIKPYCRKSAGLGVLQLFNENEGIFIFDGNGWNLTDLSRNTSNLHHSTMMRDNWAFNVANWSVNTSSPWKQIPMTSPAPEPRWKQGFTKMEGANAMLVFGGYKLPGHGSKSIPQGYLGDLWKFTPDPEDLSQSKWEQIYLQSIPSPRRSHIMVHTSTNDSVIFGGKNNKSTCITSIYIWKNGTNGYKSYTPFPETCRWGQEGKVVMLDGSEHLVFYGGRYKLHHNVYHYYDELWSYSFENDAWQEITPAGNGTKPQPRDHHSLFWVPETNSIYIFGGKNTSDRAQPGLADLWQFHFDTMTWTELFPSGTMPGGRFLLSYDVWRGADGTQSPQLLIFGGSKYDDDEMSVKYNDAYLYSIKDNTWTMIAENTCDFVLAPSNPLLGKTFKEVFLGFALIILVIGLTISIWNCVKSCCAKRVRGHGIRTYQSV